MAQTQPYLLSKVSGCAIAFTHKTVTSAHLGNGDVHCRTSFTDKTHLLHLPAGESDPRTPQVALKAQEGQGFWVVSFFLGKGPPSLGSFGCKEAAGGVSGCRVYVGVQPSALRAVAAEVRSLPCCCRWCFPTGAADADPA